MASFTTRARSHYETLEIEQSATLKDVKTAYKRLAILHHPDRNLGREKEATVKFREIAEAYEVLSDDSLRRDYDRSLKVGGDGGRSGGGSSTDKHFRQQRQRDPYEQFTSVFKTDPFFAEEFRNMNELFDNRFVDGDTTNNCAKGSAVASNNEGGGWFLNKVREWFPNISIEVSTSTSSALGGTTETRNSYGKRGEGGRSSTYASRSKRTAIENGQRVTIQSIEKNGNKIEEKYVGSILIARKVNGVNENIDVGGNLVNSG